MSVSVFAEGTFEEQLQELLEYTARGSHDDERTALVQSLQDAVKNPPLDNDRRRAALELVLKNTKIIGQGTDQGMSSHDRALPSDIPAEIEGFFNLLYSHLFTLYQADSADARQRVLYLLNVISSSSSHTASVKYRV